MGATIQAAPEDQDSFTRSNLFSGLEVPGHCFTALSFCKLICTECNNCYEDYIKCGFDARKSLLDIPLAGPFFPEFFNLLNPPPVDSVYPPPVHDDPVIPAAVDPITPWQIYPWSAEHPIPNPTENVVPPAEYESDLKPRPTSLPDERPYGHPSHETTAHPIKPLNTDPLPVSAEPMPNLPLKPYPNAEPEPPAEHESYLEVQTTSLPGHPSQETTTGHPNEPLLTDPLQTTTAHSSEPLLTDPLPTSSMPVSINPPPNLSVKPESTDEPELLVEQESSLDPWATSLPPESLPVQPSLENP
ncbi:uncharacterized protein Shrm isoform X2 [Panulirus ornatus]